MSPDQQPLRTPVADREALLAMIPHQGGMCLLDEVLHYSDDEILCRTHSHLRADNPLRVDGRIAAVHLCEYGAQSMAVHGGLLAARDGGRARPGLLVSLRGVELHVDRIDDLLPEPLEIVAGRLMAAADSWQYQFRIQHRGALLAEGRAAVMLMPPADNSATGAGPG